MVLFDCGGGGDLLKQLAQAEELLQRHASANNTVTQISSAKE
jgi:hypothetical protein